MYSASMLQNAKLTAPTLSIIHEFTKWNAYPQLSYTTPMQFRVSDAKTMQEREGEGEREKARLHFK